MLNTQPAEGRAAGLGDGAVEVHSIWDTVQGEGPFAGIPATFIRLAGCNLQCEHCDTDYTSRRVHMLPAQVRTAVNELPAREVVVITGGEPLRQEIVPLVEALLDLLPRRRVQIETNGVFFLDCDQFGCRDFLTVVCSPKTPRIHQEMWDMVDAAKYVLDADEVDSSDGLPLKSVGPRYGRPARPPQGWHGKIYVQPLDELDEAKNERNLKAAAESCQMYGYRLCVQIQKLCGLK